MNKIYDDLVKTKGFSPAHKIILKKSKTLMELLGFEKILEIGAASGYLTKEFKKMNLKIDVVEKDQYPKDTYTSKADKVFAGSIEEDTLQKEINQKYDLIICADVLEHLVNPKRVLEFLKTKINNTGRIIISIPNIAYWDMRKQLFFRGDFTYKESGLLDKTHLRFYSYFGFLELLKLCGLDIIDIIPAEARFPFEYSIKKIPVLGKLIIKKFKDKIIFRFPNLCFFHYVIEVQKKS